MGGVKIPFDSVTQAGPITSSPPSTRSSSTSRWTTRCSSRRRQAGRKGRPRHVAQGDPLPLRGRHPRRRPACGEAGSRRSEEVKRYTGFGTGPCQGKECLRAVACAVAEAARSDPAALRRSPRARRWCRSSWACWRRPGAARDTPTRQMTARGIGNHADMVIVGGGVMGLASRTTSRSRRLEDRRPRRALPRRGRVGSQRRRRAPAVVDRDEHPADAGVDGDLRRFADDVGVNVWFRQGGYLFLARTEAEAARLEKNIAIQNRCGVPTRMIALDEARDLCRSSISHGLDGGTARRRLRTTRPTASCSRGRSCGATRVAAERTASRSAPAVPGRRPSPRKGRRLR